MSLKRLDKVWIEAQKDLEDVLEKEISRSKSTRHENEEEKLCTLTTFYVKFIAIMRKLEDCYNRILHPQKRVSLKQLLESVMSRVVELKHDMVSINFSESFNWTSIMSDFSLTPDDIVVPVPKYFYIERLDIINERTVVMDSIQERFGLSEEKVRPFVSSSEEAILLIQRMERARQGQRRAQNMFERASQKNCEKNIYNQSGSTNITCKDPQISAVKIQRVWKGFSTWQKIQKEREEEMALLGMVYLPVPETLTSQKSAEQFEDRFRLLQLSGENDCRSTFDRFKHKIFHDQGDSIKENFENEIRNWFFTYKELAGNFPDYPSDDEGGYQSNLLTDVEKIILKEQEEEKMRLHKEKKASRNSKASGQSRQKVKVVSKKESVESDSNKTKKTSNCLPMLMSACDIYKRMWESKLYLSVSTPGGNTETHDVNLLYQSAKTEVETEVKSQVDILMKLELQILKMAFLKDKGKKGKKLNAALKDKKKKTKSGKRKRKEKDHFPGRSNESLFEELVRETIVKQYPKVNLHNYIGEDYFGPVIKDEICPPLSSAEVRRVLTEYCILPLGCPSVHSKCPLVKSVLIVGASKSGKTMLVHAICNELGATLFDLTASNLVGKYTSREDLRTMFNLISKVGRVMQPSVILVEDADLMFMKSVSKIDKSDPKRIKKGLQKLIKGIEAEDLMLVIGTARRPFECDMKSLASTFNKIIVLPQPDHTSRNTLWKTKIRSLGGDELSPVDFGNLVKVSDGYSSGVIVNSIVQVLSAHRVALQKRKPLQLQEFIVALSKWDPVYKEEEESLKMWSQRTPLAKKRAAALEPEENKKAREKLLSKKRKQMELEKRFYGGEKGKKKKGSKKKK